MPADYRLGDVESQIYEACDAGIGVSSLRTKLGLSSPSEEAPARVPCGSRRRRPAFREEDRYLSLAVEARPREIGTPRRSGFARAPTLTLREIHCGLALMKPVR